MQDTTGTFPEASSPISLREYGDVLRRRRAIILQTFVIVLVGGVLVTLFTPPTFQASARLLLEAPTYMINSVSTSDPLADLFRINQQYSMGTQVELLQSPEIRKKVSEKLNTSNLPGMSVSVLEGTQIIQVVSEGDNPELVASAPNALLEAYVEQVDGNSKEELVKARNFAKSHATQASNDLNRLELALSKFKRSTNIAELAATKQDLLNQVSLLGTSLRDVEAQVRTAQSREATIRTNLRNQAPKINDVKSEWEDREVRAIDDQLFALDTQKYALKVTDVDAPEKAEYGEDDPRPSVRMITLNRQIDKLTKRKQLLIQKMAERNARANPVYAQLMDDLLKNSIDVSGLTGRMVTTSEQIRAAQDKLAKLPEAERRWNQLTDQIERTKKDFEYYNNRANELELRTQTKKKGSQIMQRAEVPTSPIRPKRFQNIALAGVLGLFFGLCLALLQELFDDRINSPEEAERVLRLPSLGHVPLIEEEGLRLIKDISTFSPLMEAYRSLRTNINFAAVGNPVHSILITSSVPAEGKSTTVANLAMAMALDNKRVIIVDADLRRPSQHKLFRTDSSPGLTDILVGTHSIDEVLRDTDVKNVRILPAGSPPPNPAELLGSAAMRRLLDQLEEMADIVLLDSPPALAVADSIVLASRTNGALLVVGYGETKKTNSKKALELLSRANANVLGTVLNRMDGPSSGYYYGKYYVPGTSERGSGSNGSGAVTAAGASGNGRALPSGDSSTDPVKEENS